MSEKIIGDSSPRWNDYTDLLDDKDKQRFDKSTHYVQEPLALALMRAMEDLRTEIRLLREFLEKKGV